MLLQMGRHRQRARKKVGNTIPLLGVRARLFVSSHSYPDLTDPAVIRVVTIKLIMYYTLHVLLLYMCTPVELMCVVLKNCDHYCALLHT